ncbi:hypothetical protein DCS_01341 [Drechmeria coniospora]|uniref:Cyclin-dependent kinase n=1 Tax=Drechmeria coniospora TaxID=98403 RepID=A0A151GSX3_DRECN|nr:hypothetical protein DCS_01341 [Drechmeria coniospora]KYK60205.1 hypothetical protein DCS_01341 [Drechmeria coniospora]
MDAQHSAAASIASPAKKRAPLAPLDANAMSASPVPVGKDGTTLHRKSATPTGNPLKLAAAVCLSTSKRPAVTDAVGSPKAKKACLERDEVWMIPPPPLPHPPRSTYPHYPRPTLAHDGQQRSSRSHSPDSVSVFDTSAGDASWVTTTSEPDILDRPALRLPRPGLTREQAREKAEILRLRLGLASYKVRTGQVAVPLADLLPRPLPSPRPAVRLQSPSATSAGEARARSYASFDARNDASAASPNAPDTIDDARISTSMMEHGELEPAAGRAQDQEEHGKESESEPARRVSGGQDDSDAHPPATTNNALRSGAASGLLSLARAIGGS